MEGPCALVIGGGRSAADVERVVADLKGCGWRAQVALAPSPQNPLPPGPFRIQVEVHLDGPALEAARNAAATHPNVPIVAIGGEPGAGTIWFRQPPSPTLWDPILKELATPTTADSPSPGPRWRRKGDMILGHSAATQELLRILDRLAPSTAPVLVTGESGTGKELVARALHFSGPRAANPFIALNCAAIPESLVEAELFGHQRGAFTGAVAQRTGAFEAAHSGTLFLDEIGEMPLQHQAKLLRVLETGEIVRIGSNTARKVDVRVVAATNRDLAAEVGAGRFREDLYYRLKVYPVHLEPLRSRPEDIPPIIHHHLGMIAQREKRRPLRLSPQALEQMLAHRWPGNVREVVNVLERACLLAQGEVIEPGDLGLAPAPDPGPRAAVSLRAPQTLPGYREAKQQFETEYYQRVLSLSGGNISQAARLAQKTRKEVYDALKRLGLEVPTRRAG